MKADQLDIYTTKAVVTHLHTSIQYTLQGAERITFRLTPTKLYRALRVTLESDWTDAQGIPQPKISIAAVSVLKDGSDGDNYITTHFNVVEMGYTSFEELLQRLTVEYYKAARMQETAHDSLGYVRPEYLEAK